MTRLFIPLFLSFLAGPFFVTAQYPSDNNAASSSQSSVAAAPAVKTPTGRSSTTPARKLLAPGWQKEDDQVTGKFNRDMLTRMKMINNQLIGFLYDSCLEGSAHHSSWHGEFRSDKSDSTGLNYGIKCSFPAREGQPTENPALSVTATLEITANSLSPLTRQVTVYGHEYTAITPTKAIRNGCPYFEPPYRAEGAMMVAISAGKKNAPHINTWLVTARPDDLPYTPMSRKEFLEEMNRSLKTNKDLMITTIKAKNPVRTQSDQDAEKQRSLESLSTTYSGAELQMRKRNYLDHYKSDEEDLKEIIDAQTAPIDSNITFIDGMLHRLAPATLAAPAYVSAKANEFEGFADGEEDAVLLIHRVVSTAAPIATPDKPRYFVVTWTYDPADTEAAVIKGLLNKKLDAGYMRELLKK